MLLKLPSSIPFPCGISPNRRSQTVSYGRLVLRKRTQVFWRTSFKSRVSEGSGHSPYLVWWRQISQALLLAFGSSNSWLGRGCWVSKIPSASKSLTVRPVSHCLHLGGEDGGRVVPFSVRSWACEHLPVAIMQRHGGVLREGGRNHPLADGAGQ
jgi:hypothetical protein